MSKLRYNKAYLEKLELLFQQAGYQIRYEKGNFQAGYCLLRSQRIIVINKFFPLEGRISCLLDLLQQLHMDTLQLSNEQRALLQKLRAD